MTRTPPWHNWARLAASEPTRIEHPSDPDQVVASVRRAREQGRTVKMVGTGHSFTSISAPVDTMLVPQRLQGLLSVDHEAGTATALAGTPLHVLNAELEKQGLTLTNMGDIAQQTLAGATSTGTHGSGGTVASLSAQLAGLEMVTGTGELVRASVEENPDLFEFARIGLGALGILTTLTFRVEPVFVMRADERSGTWSEMLAEHDRWTAEHDHVDIHWFPYTDGILLKVNDRTDVPLAEAEPLSRLRAWWDDDFTANRVFGAMCTLGHAVPPLVPGLNRVATKAVSSRRYSDVPHRVFISPRDVVFRECEYAVPREAGLSALREVRAVIERNGWPISFPVEIRTAPADDIPLSTAYGRDAMYLAFHVPQAVDHRDYFAAMESIMRHYDGRPHWGKLHRRAAEDLAPAYPRFAEFQALRDRLDPDRLFRNKYLDRVLGH